MKISSKLFSYNSMFTKGQMNLESAEFYQIAELSIIRSGEILEHIQYCDEITYAISGKATIYSEDSETEITAGQIHFIRQGQYHKIVAHENHNFRYFCIGFSLNPECESVQRFLDAIGDKQFFFAEDSCNIKTLFENLIDESYILDNESNLMIHFYFCQILLHLCRILTGQANKKISKMNHHTSNYAIYRTLRYIDKEYLTISNVKQISEHLSYSEYYLSHIFKQKMNITMKDYLTQKKILAATKFLADSNMSISEISERLSFSSLNSFGLAFKRYTGMSASDFRKTQTNHTNE